MSWFILGVQPMQVDVTVSKALSKAKEAEAPTSFWATFQCVAVCCSVLQCVAVCCSVFVRLLCHISVERDLRAFASIFGDFFWNISLAIG